MAYQQLSLEIQDKNTTPQSKDPYECYHIRFSLVGFPPLIALIHIFGHNTFSMSMAAPHDTLCVLSLAPSTYHPPRPMCPSPITMFSCAPCSPLSSLYGLPLRISIAFTRLSTFTSFFSVSWFQHCNFFPCR